MYTETMKNFSTDEYESWLSIEVELLLAVYKNE